MPFWLTQYRELLLRYRATGRVCMTVADFIRRPRSRAVVLRHDVDRWPARATEMAKLEMEVGVSASYYFRCNGWGQFPVAAIRAIRDARHEVGYHYEDFSRCGGRLDEARAAFASNLAVFRRIATCETVSMHGAPMSNYNNSQLLAGADLTAWGLLGAGDLLHGHRVTYLTDAGGRWNDPTVNFRDRSGDVAPRVNPLTAEGLETVLSTANDEVIYMNTHPERWSGDLGGYLISSVVDTAALVVKACLRRRR